MTTDRHSRSRWGSIFSVLMALSVVMAASSCGGEPPPELATVEAELSPVLEDRDDDLPSLRLVSPIDGQEVTSPFRLSAMLENSELAPKGRVRDGEGHLHVLIDQPCVSPGTVIPDDTVHIHIGTGTRSVELDLEVGEHRLCVQVGDGFHSATSIQAELTVIVIG